MDGGQFTKENKIQEDVFYNMVLLGSDFTKTILEKCPIIFRREPMIWNWSIDIDQGWYLIVYELSVKIEALVQKYKDEGRFITPEQYSKRFDITIPEREELPLVTQVKQKYGVLCYYTMGMPIEVKEWMSDAIELASHTCEICGSEEDVKTKDILGWVWTLCPKCARDKYQNTKTKFENIDEFLGNLRKQMKEIDEEVKRRIQEDE